MRYLIPYLKKYKREAIIAPLFKMLEACFDLIVPKIVASIVNKGIAEGDRRYIITRFAMLLGMAVLGLACSFVAQYFAAKASVGTATGLRRQLLEKIQSLSFTELDKIGTSTLITRMTSDVNQVQSGANMFLRLFLRSPFIVFGAMIMAFTINAEIALIFVAAIIVMFVIVFGIMFITAPMYKNVQKELDGVTGATREDLNGVRVIRAFGREEIQNEKFTKINSALTKAQLRVGKFATLMNPLTYVVVNAVIVLILWLGAEKVNGGTLLSGDVIALINYIGQILVELVKLANLVVLLGKSISGMGRIGQVLDTESSMAFDGTNIGLDCDEIIRFDNVSLKYAEAGADSLTDISFSANRGDTIGIIGGTGSGKSSLVRLIPRFYDATKGCVYLKEEPIKSLSKDAVLSSVAIVDQKPRLFSGTIRSNMLWGNKNATDDDIWHALETAQAAEFVRQKPDGLDEKVLQGGSNLSGGQKQRLTIARALLSGADILILDDSTSALDYATDAALRKAIKALPENLTVIIVSQRAGSIAYADKILVLDDGKLVGIGKHEELLESCSVYKEIYESQFGTEAKQ
ncbi:MAG: ABC transporter ATP-binding protein [Eubacteriales bacterium]|nr:ABC transporter ATP-binding protein [Eubacterium sp.]MDY5492932.1 ABC transporter ATP-binding protein [Eubacteriales bacterium]